MTAEEMQGVGKNSLLDRFHLVFRNYITKTKSKRKENKQTKNPHLFISWTSVIEESQRGGKLEISHELFRMNNKTLIKLAFPMMKGVKNCANFWGCDNIFVDLHKLILHIRCRQRRPDFRLCTFLLRLRERGDLDNNMWTLPEYNYYGHVSSSSRNW